MIGQFSNKGTKESYLSKLLFKKIVPFSPNIVGKVNDTNDINNVAISFRNALGQTVMSRGRPGACVKTIGLRRFVSRPRSRNSGLIQGEGKE